MKYNPYSVSKIDTFNTCPKKFEYQYILKPQIIKEPQLALMRGSFAHEVLENDFNYNIEFKINDVFTLEEKEKVIQMLKIFRKSDVGIKIEKVMKIGTKEEDFAFDKNLEFKDFWDKTSWMRGSADLFYYNSKTPDKYYIWDYKTGKDKSKEEFGKEQGMMYSVVGFIKYPEVKIIKCTFVFIEHGTQKTLEFKRENFNDYIKFFYNKTKKIENSKFFKENVSALCDYCDYGKQSFCIAPIEAQKKTDAMLTSKISFDF